MTENRDAINGLAEAAREHFVADESVKSMQQFLDDVRGRPSVVARDAPQYILNMMEHFGASEVARVGGAVRRWNVFDTAFDGGRERVHGQEDVQNEIYRSIRNFVLTGKSDRLVLLHGPNGSSKSSIVDALFRGLEHYSRLPEGALYRFSWVFPKMKYLGRQVGFESAGRGGRAPDGEKTFAFLDLEEIAARVPCELKDHPLFVMPVRERRELLGEHSEEDGGEGRPRIGRWIREGELCPKCRAIYDALLVAYEGDLSRVFAHVQVQRYYISRRYRQGAVTIDPQVTTDAQARQITMDRSLGDLPPYLQNLSLFQMLGDLIDANGGIVEYSDLLKRSVETNKYLLTACETGFITMGSVSAQLNLVMIGSGNERHLELFKKSADFTSFRGRFRLVPTPYLLEYTQEEQIYRDQLEPLVAIKHLAPHTTSLAAVWAVLTRLRRPDPSSHVSEIRDVIRKLTPLAKAKLYDHGECPRALPSRERNTLLSAVPRLRSEYRDEPAYEGRFGASPREVRDLLLDCFYEDSYACVSPQALFAKLEQIVQEKTLYEFLSIDSDNRYHDAAAFVEDVREEFLDRVHEEVRDSLDLVASDEYQRLFERYVHNVKAFVKKEKIRHEATKSLVPPDEHLMAQVEKVLGVESDVDAFRASLIGRIGAWTVDHPDEEISLETVFAEYLTQLKEDFYRDRKKVIEQISRHLLTVGTDEFELLDADVRSHVVGALGRMRERYGYCDRCAKEAIVFLIQRRYS